MKAALPTLLRAELRRLVTPGSFVATAMMAVLTSVFLLAVSKSQNVMQLNDVLMNFVHGLIIPFGVPFIAVSMVAGDIQTHWLRTLLMRPVTRTEYLLARVSAVTIFSWGMILVSGLLPVVVMSSILGTPLVVLPSRSLPALVFLLGHAYTVVVLLTLLSCHLPGLLNMVALGVWALSSALLGQYVKYQAWDNATLVIAKDFLFPSGFADAAQAAAMHQGDVMAPALWGLGAAVCFTALAFWSVNRVQVESGSE